MPQPLPAIDRAWTGPRPPVSVVILTLNEQANIEAAIASCAWADDVHVLDSGSTDRTVAVAAAAGAAVHTNPFQSFGKQRNWAIDNIPLRHDWVFHLDADERFTPDLVREIDRVVAGSPAESGFYVANQMILMDTWIKHASGYPAYQMRLFHKARMRFADHGHGQREDTSGAIGTLRSPYLHFNFSKGLDDWFARHNRYSTLEAAMMLEELAQPLALSGFFSSDSIARRRTLKRLAARLPARPLLRRLYTLFIQGAILDGPAGRLYASMLATYDHMTAIKLKALRNGSRRP